MRDFKTLDAVQRNWFELFVKMIATFPIARVRHANPRRSDVALLVPVRSCQSCGLDHRLRIELIASSVIGILLC